MRQADAGEGIIMWKKYGKNKYWHQCARHEARGAGTCSEYKPHEVLARESKVMASEIE